MYTDALIEIATNVPYSLPVLIYLGFLVWFRKTQRAMMLADFTAEHFEYLLIRSKFRRPAKIFQVSDTDVSVGVVKFLEDPTTERKARLFLKRAILLNHIDWLEKSIIPSFLLVFSVVLSFLMFLMIHSPKLVWTLSFLVAIGYIFLYQVFSAWENGIINDFKLLNPASEQDAS